MWTSRYLCKYNLALSPTALMLTKRCLWQRWCQLSAVSDSADAHNFLIQASCLWKLERLDNRTPPMHGSTGCVAQPSLHHTQQNTIDPCLGGIMSGVPTISWIRLGYCTRPADPCVGKVCQMPRCFFLWVPSECHVPHCPTSTQEEQKIAKFFCSWAGISQQTFRPALRGQKGWFWG
jgi:hypothetical protein